MRKSMISTRTLNPTRGALLAMAWLVCALLPAPARAAPDVTGTWMTDDEDGAVLIEPCGEGVCGRIVWLKAALDENGQSVRDENNKDPGQRGRPMCGLAILHDVPPKGEGWEGGWVYDPDSGSRYSVSLARGEGDILLVTGFIGVKALGQTFQWHRAPAALPRCDAPAAGKPRPANKGS